MRVGRDGLHVVDEPLGGFVAPVARDEGPHDGAHALLEHELTEPRTAETEGRAKETWFGPSGLADGFTAAEQFGAGFGRSAKEEIGMRVSVIAEDVATIGDFADKGGRFADPFADDKEGGFGVMAVEQLEKLGSDGRIGTVIEGEREFFGVVGAAKRVAEKLGARMDGAVGGESTKTCEEGGNSNEPRLHGAILP